MTRRSRYLTLGAVSGGAMLLAAYVGLQELRSPMCGNTEVSSAPSPNGRLRVVVFERDCGATTESSTQVAILSAGEPLANQSTGVFVIDSDHGRAAPGPGGAPWVTVQWLADRSLLIRYDDQGRIFQQAAAFGGVTVQYVAVHRAAA